jgi:hypothetical protein
MKILIVDDESQAKLLTNMTRVLGESVDVVCFDPFENDELYSAMAVFCELGQERAELQSLFASVIKQYNPNVILLDYLYGPYGLGQVFEEAILEELPKVTVYMHSTTPWRMQGLLFNKHNPTDEQIRALVEEDI